MQVEKIRVECFYKIWDRVIQTAWTTNRRHVLYFARINLEKFFFKVNTLNKKIKPYLPQLPKCIEWVVLLGVHIEHVFISRVVYNVCNYIRGEHHSKYYIITCGNFNQFFFKIKNSFSRGFFVSLHDLLYSSVMLEILNLAGGSKN